jgi:ornithine cyclodeaminase/alanine dehydrogenase-like protein (mu-crystallin family)
VHEGSVLATRILLGSPESAQPTSILALGAGKQIEAHVDLLLRTYPSIARVAIFNRTINSRAMGLLQTLLPRHPNVDFTASAIEGYDLRTVLAEASIIVAATSSTVPLLQEYERYVRSGAHVILVGSYTPKMHEVSGDILARTGGKGGAHRYRILVDSRKACLEEAGELVTAGVGADGAIEIGELVEERGESIVVDEKAVRAVREAGDLTVFKSVGVGVQDVAIADFVVRRAEEMELGTRVPNFHAS